MRPNFQSSYYTVDKAFFPLFRKLPALKSCYSTNIVTCTNKNVKIDSRHFRDIIDYICTPAGRKGTFNIIVLCLHFLTPSPSIAPCFFFKIYDTSFEMSSFLNYISSKEIDCFLSSIPITQTYWCLKHSIL